MECHWVNQVVPAPKTMNRLKRLNTPLYPIGNHFSKRLGVIACLLIFPFGTAWEPMERWFDWLENQVGDFARPPFGMV